MATAMALPDVQGKVSSYLFLEYILRMTDPRLGVDERLALRMKMEYFLDEVARQPGARAQVQALVGRPFETAQITEQLLPAVKWYLEFIAGKGESWYENISTELMNRFIKAARDWSIKEHAFRLILLHETHQNTGASGSYIVRFFRALPGLSPSGDLTEDGESIVRLLIYERLTAPEVVGATDLRTLILQILAICLKGNSDSVPTVLRNRVLELAGEIGETSRRVFEAILSRPGD